MPAAHWGLVGSAHSGDSATPAPNASAVRRSVPTLPGSDTCHSASTTSRAPVGKVGAPVDADHARRVAERRDLAEELRQDVVTRDEQLDRLDASGCRRLDEILALDREEPRLGLRCLRAERASGRAGASRSDADSIRRSGGLRASSASSAAFARSATAANACRIAHGDVGERLAVELDPGLLHARDELVVREAVLRARPR